MSPGLIDLDLIDPNVFMSPQSQQGDGVCLSY